MRAPAGRYMYRPGQRRMRRCQTELGVDLSERPFPLLAGLLGNLELAEPLHETGV
jgi:hypothetical protein